MGTPTVRVTDAQGFVHDMLPAMNMPVIGRHLFSGGTVAFKGVNTVIAKKSYLDVGPFNIPLRRDIKCPAIDCLDLELAPRGNYQTEAAFVTKAISGHTIPTGSALASQRFRSGAMGAVNLSQRRHGHLSRHLRRRQVPRRYRLQPQLIACA